MAINVKIITSLVILILALPVSAEQSTNFGAYTVHYNAFTTNNLSPEMAKIYNITRSSKRALLNVSILKQGKGTATRPVKARVTATATNMNLQLTQLTVRELVEPGEPGAVYYLAETSVNNGDTIKYDVSFTPDGEEQSFSFNFQQQFITQ